MDGEERTTKYAEGAKWATELLLLSGNHALSRISRIS